METIAILWAIGAVALMVAINARGAFRVTLSWILALGVLGFALLCTSLKGAGWVNRVSGEEVLPIPAPSSAPSAQKSSAK
jgi:hypothetical protein